MGRHTPTADQIAKDIEAAAQYNGPRGAHAIDSRILVEALSDPLNPTNAVTILDITGRFQATYEVDDGTMIEVINNLLP